MILQYILFRRSKFFTDVRKYCLEYADSQKMVHKPFKTHVPTRNQKRLQKHESVEGGIDDLCREVEKLHLMIFKQPR